jgi:hypothetical protein
MRTVVCTLFEGHYQVGLAALLNSLVKCGFSGAVVAGYRGALPEWASPYLVAADNCVEFKLTNDITVHFVKVETQAHLTNFKPDFMLEIWDRRFAEADALFYFDPDITIQCKWQFFEKWIQAGVALCMDVNGDLSENHPLRWDWKDYFSKVGIDLKVPRNVYFNGGFIGLERRHRDFLEMWRDLQNLAWPATEGAERWQIGERTFMFFRTDQDLLNVTTMLTTLPISWIGKDGMDLEPGGYIMSHALGSPKPWEKSMLWRALAQGQFPSRADKRFFSNVDAPIVPFPPFRAALKKLDLAAASALGRYLA